MKLFIIISFVLNAAFGIYQKHLKKSWRSNPLPDNVKDVYDKAEYAKWQAYEKDYDKIGMIENTLSTAMELAFLIFNLVAKIFYAFPINRYLQYLLCMIIVNGAADLISVPCDYYDTFVIEEKYGMNKTIKKTFVLDFIKGKIIDIVLSFGLLALIIFLYERFGNAGFFWITVAIIAISLLFAFLSMPFMRIFNKFKPLEDGELKDKLLELCAKYGITVKKIVVMDASRRTTKANAFCTGFGKSKTISLDDNLVNDYTTDQIVAVFAHEFAHAKFRHMVKSIPFALARTVFTIVWLWIVFNIPSLYTAFGFYELNYVFAFSMAGMFSWPVEILLDFISNRISRAHEYEADAFAAKNGYGQELISALKKLCKESLSDINPHPFIVKLNYSHPTLSQRIAAIEQQSQAW